MIRNRLFDVDPYAGFNPKAYPIDLQGWASDHRYLPYAIERSRPTAIVEVGSWKGRSAINMARKVRDLGLSCEVLCVDTWLGSPEHWLRGGGAEDWYGSLLIKNGFPSLYNTFMANVMAENLNDIITPFPSNSENAACVLASFDASFDICYIDAAHEYEAVMRDLKAYWPLIRTPGILIGDDFYWEGTHRAAVEFALSVGVELKEEEGKYLLAKGTWTPELK